MKTYLKIKQKSLAAESRIIKQEERKWKGDHPLRASLRQHRIYEVRVHSRSTNLAYGFLRGRTYLQVENKTYRKPDWMEVERLAIKYATDDIRGVKQKFTEWKSSYVLLER